MMNPNYASIILLLFAIYIVSASSSYDYNPAKHDEEKKTPDSNYNNYDRNDHDNSDKDNEDDGEDHVFSLTVSELYSDYDKNEKKSSNNDVDSLDPYYYYKSCPDFESIVSEKVSSLADKNGDDSLLASLLRLHFHDCVVRGCDASILLNHKGSERNAAVSKTLRGYEIIDEIKAEVEKKCPRTVSCADILTAAARDATVVSGGKYWRVDYGRKDGFVSRAEEADSLVPMGRETITDLIEKFQSLGLDIDDMVALSGAHTIGRSSCGSIQYWLYNKNTTREPYSSLNQKYFDYLQRKCRWASDYVELDPRTPKYFDNEYYTNLVYWKIGLLSTDRLLYSDRRTSNIVKTLAYDRSTFYQQFKKSMKKLGNVQVLTGPNEGEIRANCNFVNSHY